MGVRVCWKMAWETMVSNRKIFLPFLIGISVIITILYSTSALVSNPALNDPSGDSILGALTFLSQTVTIFFSLFLLMYFNRVLTRTRKQEQGLFAILGMDNKHLAIILFFQYLILFVGSSFLGLLMGVLFDKGMGLLGARLLMTDNPQGFRFDGRAATLSLLIGMAMFIFLFLLSVVALYRKKPIDTTQEAKAGETEIKNRWILAIIGVACLGAGYWIALTERNILTGLMLFFFAAVLVVIGTYSLFYFGSSCILSLLQKNKKYYYKLNHFLSVSTMRYRLRENAASLASISVMSTVIVIGISCCSTLMINVNKMAEKQVPMEMVTTIGIKDPQKFNQEEARKALLSTGLAQEPIGFLTSCFVPYTQENGIWNAYAEGDGVADLNYFAATTIETINGGEKKEYSLPSDTLFMKFLETSTELPSTIEINQRVYNVLPFPEEIDTSAYFPFSVSTTTEVVFPSLVDLMDATKMESLGIDINYNLTSKAKEQLAKGIEAFQSPSVEFQSPYMALSYELEQKILAYNDQHQNSVGDILYLQSVTREGLKEDLLKLMSSILFFGIYVVVLFACTTVLLMYYKQLSEGMSDRQRFQILQRVGLDPKQIKKVVNDQVVLIFFLPLALAALHLVMALPMIDFLLQSSAMVSSPLLWTVSFITFAGFIVFYLVSYWLTTNTYYLSVR